MSAAWRRCAILPLLLAGCAQPATEGVLRACLGEADPPRALRGAEGAKGFDVEVAALIARDLHRTLAITWLPRPTRTEIESTDMEFRPLLAGRCDLMLSVPGADAVAPLGTEVLLSDPYYGTAYEIIPADGKLKAGSVVAVRSNTVAHVVVDSRGYHWTMQPDAQAIVDAVTSGAADVGLIWGPELAALATERNDSFEPPELLRWNQHAAVARKQAPLLATLNRILAQRQGEIQSLLRRHHMPAHPPWPTVHDHQALRGL